jgi:protease-4
MMALPADKIYMPTEGLLEMNGISISSLFLKEFLSEIGVKYHVQQYEEYKSAGETYSRNSFSEQAREQLGVLLTQRYDSITSTISRYRGIPVQQIKNDMERGVYTADSVLALGYIDGYMTESALRRVLAQLAVGDEPDMDNISNFRTGYDIRQIRAENNGEYEEEEKLHLISVGNYLKWNKTDIDVEDIDEDIEIAVIYGSGPISSGFQDKSPFGNNSYQIRSGSYIKYLKKARENDKIKAVVLRIDSPGGSVIASDEIWEEIMKTRMVKPVYASMSDVAASGGYYMSMACDTIFAHPETVTGSIGVILAVPNFSGTMDMVGLNLDTISTGPAANFMNPLLEVSERDKETLENLSESIYMRFITRAAESRGMEVEELRQLAKGRVWTGSDAKERGLVDVLGGLDEAIDYAKSAVGVEEGKLVRVRQYPKTRDSFEEFLEDLLDQKKDEEANTGVNIRNALADMMGLSPDAFIKQWDMLPLEARKELIYTYQLIEIAGEEKAMYAMPYQHYFN